ncbi:purine-nucleoside phosphorylase [Pseudobacteroides cellulosolvens]|uniref:Purine nucleoside phosphorylase n=1 Tax=Pseudobacteroides cellulosolvens ATCC 35603 = DSM 2933 TaxID=398512 RepID=A0A0L6JQX9_9FIRM|nr:purine-nucleoside phosphorylase [Pseudobacteroides cellulosolvens]KNY28231.1 purine nucleoside phosphorylase I, inosine and guanosine-specific [Pseudobacteroides cellulosolvens ATCC 35603 = DSM 2933]
MYDTMSRIKETAEFISTKLTIKPEIAVILGSGLGPLAERIEDRQEIEYSDIPNFPITTVEGHAGKLIAGSLGSKKILALKGRFHYYEGYDISQVVFPVRVLKQMGINNIIVTNAAGGINKNFKPGDIMAITDHIGLFAPSALRGKNINEFGPRFPDMTEAYDKDAVDLIEKVAAALGIEIKKGVYAYAKGPMFETPAEIIALRAMGADAVGMSTVPEVVTAVHSGMKVLGISCITNMAAGILNQKLNHEEVIQTTRDVENKFVSVVMKFVESWRI